MNEHRCNVYIYTTEHYSVIKKKSNTKKNAICSNMDETRDNQLSKVSDKEKDKYHMISLI